MAKKRFNIQHLAQLAQLKLDEQNRLKYTSQLADILDYVETLQTINTKSTQPTDQIVELKNVWREDTMQKSLASQDSLANARQTQGNFFKVKAVLENKDN